MKILVQNQEMVIETPRNMWITKVGSRGLVVCSNELNPIIGTYATPDRAREVLNEIFVYIKDGKKTYVMPQE